jgi:lipoate-protein ligase A
MKAVPTTWRLLDTGPVTAAENMALDEVLLTARSRDAVPTTVRFLQFSPAAALVGVYQTLAEELRLDFAQEQGLDVNRRLTGGGAIFFDESQLGWELVGSTDDVGRVPAAALFERLCAPVVAALVRLGLDASFRPRNDIEVDGRKISGTGGTAEGNAFLFQGTLLTDFDVDTMLRVLRVPVEKLKRKEIESLKERVTCLAWELGQSPPLDHLKRLLVEELERAFGVRLVPGELSELERDLLAERLPFYASQEWIRRERLPRSRKDYLRGYARVASGVLKASVIYDRAQERVEYLVFSGDFFAFPRRAVYDLEAALKGVPRAEVVPAIDAFLETCNADFAGLTAAEFSSAVEDALHRIEYESRGIQTSDVNSVFTIVEPVGSVAERGATALLLPYCAKPVDCDLRHTEECTSCGRCAVGTAYDLAHELGMEVTTITSFEHLMVVLADLRRRSVSAFVGSCCEAFYLKHRDEMESHGVPGVLVDVGSDTCYDLGRVRQAYDGAFEGETVLKPDLLESVVRACARRAPKPAGEQV